MAIIPSKYQDYIQGKISLDEASGGAANNTGSWITGNAQYVKPWEMPSSGSNGSDSTSGRVIPLGGYTTPPGAVVKPPPVALPGWIGTPIVTSPVPVPPPVPPVLQASARDLRQQAMNSNVWSNDTTIAVLEKKSWAIYVETGRWDTPEQKQYHDQSEAIRKGLNPLYPGSPDGGPQNGYILPTDQFPTTNGMDMKGLVTYGALGLGAVMILSMFRR